MLGTESSVPAYSAALERRLGARTWIALNARFSHDARDSLPFPTNTDPNPTTLRITTTSAAALLGLRYIFVHGLVDVSGYSGLFANVRAINGEDLRASGAVGQTGGGGRRDVGLFVGMAVERELIEALALRLSLDLAAGSISAVDSSRLDEAGVEHHQWLMTERAAFSIDPGLQLHFYF
jgi:hypothetical protein